MAVGESFGEAVARLEADLQSLPWPLRVYMRWRLRRIRRRQASLRDEALRRVGIIP